MPREWEPEELIACWTLVEGDTALVGKKSGATRLGFALLLKFFELEGRFPSSADELRSDVVGYVAQQVGVDPDTLASYDWSGRTIKYHRSQIRAAYGFREPTRADEARLASWLSEHVCPVELTNERKREALLARCRAERIEPPGRLERILAAAGAAFEKRFCDDIVARLTSASRSQRPGAGGPPEGGEIYPSAVNHGRFHYRSRIWSPTTKATIELMPGVAPWPSSRPIPARSALRAC